MVRSDGRFAVLPDVLLHSGLECFHSTEGGIPFAPPLQYYMFCIIDLVIVFLKPFITGAATLVGKQCGTGGGETSP